MSAALLANNLRWAAAKARTGYFRALSSQPPPKIFWLGCSDCGAAAHELVGLEAGAVFVHRNLANQADVHDLSFGASLQFALDTFGAEQIIVCGHYGCSGVRAALGDGMGLSDMWLRPLHALAASEELQGVSDMDARANLLCERNVAEQVYRLAAHPLMHAAWRRGQAVTVHGWVFSVHDGLLRDIGANARTTADALRALGRARPGRRPMRRRAPG